MPNIIYILKFKRQSIPIQVFNRLSDISKDLGNMTLGSVIIPYVLDRGDFVVAGAGVGIALLFWAVSVTLDYKYHE